MALKDWIKTGPLFWRHKKRKIQLYIHRNNFGIWILEKRTKNLLKTLNQFKYQFEALKFAISYMRGH